MAVVLVGAALVATDTERVLPRHRVTHSGGTHTLRLQAGQWVTGINLSISAEVTVAGGSATDLHP
ncbi:hypothetical protein KRMM14A1259_13880 [Krasilnikovia sp. MM14-A1259]